MRFKNDPSRYANRQCVKCGGIMEPQDIIEYGEGKTVTKHVVYECTQCHSILYTPIKLAKRLLFGRHK